jgi:hypothetical protein
MSPSDFYLFPTVKEILERIQLTEGDRFFERLQEIVRDIDQDDLNSGSQAWVPTGSGSKSRQWRLRQVINSFHLSSFCLISSDGLGYAIIDQTIVSSIFIMRSRLPINLFGRLAPSRDISFDFTKKLSISGVSILLAVRSILPGPLSLQDLSQRSAFMPHPGLISSGGACRLFGGQLTPRK